MPGRRAIPWLAGAVMLCAAGIGFSQFGGDRYASKALAYAARTVHVSFPPPVLAAPVDFAPAAPARGTPSLLNGGFVNGLAPAPSFRPYGETSPWNRKITASPKIAAYSAAVIAAEFAGNESHSALRSTEAGPYDYSHPVFYASLNDPLVNLACVTYCNNVDNGGIPKQAHMPAKARPAGGADAHMSVIEPDGTEIDFWALFGTPGWSPNGAPGNSWRTPHRATRDWAAGDTAAAGNITNCGNYLAGSGMAATGPASTAGGACNEGGTITAAELAAGKIDHALFLTGQCGAGTVYPAYAGAGTFKCSSGVGPPLGGRLWYDVPDATTDASRELQPWEKAVLDALHDYGGYFEDSRSGGGAYMTGLGFALSSAEAGYDFGLISTTADTDPFSALASQGWYSIALPDTLTKNRWVGPDPWQPKGVDWLHHFHWLDACSARGTC